MAYILDAKKSKPLEGGASFSLTNRLTRLAWMIVWGLLARWTPRQLAPWRAFLLRLFGAKIARGASIAGSARIWLPAHLEVGENALVGPGADIYNMAPITIGARAIVSQRSFLCTGSHSTSDPDFQLISRPITIGPKVWVAAEAFVGPGVRVGDGAVLAARACAFENLEPWTIYRGNPAVKVSERRFDTAVD